MICPRCNRLDWNPVEICQCEYSVEWLLRHPTEYQAEKWLKHGLIYDGVETLVDQSAWMKPTPGSKFTPETDISATFTIVASSGVTVIPQYNDRPLSVMFYLGKVTGGGFFNGGWQHWYGVRIVHPQDEEKIHIFPDNIRSAVDKEVICACGKAYKVVVIPAYCECGRNFIAQ